MNLLQKIQYCQYWNIGFCEQTPEELIKNKKLKPVKWLKHPFRDRWFADPFIFRVTDDEIVVFVEECPIENPKGIISELVVDRNTLSLKERYVILELDTHLSYPAILRMEGKVYVYPENGTSGKLNLYHYDDINHRLVNPVCILEDAVADATILKKNNHFYMSATKFPNTQEMAFLYESDSPFGPFRQVDKQPYQTSLSCSRQGGGFLMVNGQLYRPAQDCEEQYGAALNIMESSLQTEKINEVAVFRLCPQDNRYGLGLHTLNFGDGMMVIDGYGYYKPLLGKLYYSIRKFIYKKN